MSGLAQVTAVAQASLGATVIGTVGSAGKALIDAKPDAIFSSLFGADLARFVREGELRGLFKEFF